LHLQRICNESTRNRQFHFFRLAPPFATVIARASGQSGPNALTRMTAGSPACAGDDGMNVEIRPHFAASHFAITGNDGAAQERSRAIPR
jgi:hypothetical protein